MEDLTDEIYGQRCADNVEWKQCVEVFREAVFTHEDNPENKGESQVFILLANALEPQDSISLKR